MFYFLSNSCFVPGGMDMASNWRGGEASEPALPPF